MSIKKGHKSSSSTCSSTVRLYSYTSTSHQRPSGTSPSLYGYLVYVNGIILERLLVFIFVDWLAGVEACLVAGVAPSEGEYSYC